jgi:aflatoxin B1 aldehyde reductase
VKVRKDASHRPKPPAQSHSRSNDVWVSSLKKENHEGKILTTRGSPDKDLGARITNLDEYKNCLNVFQSKGYNELDTARVYIGGKQEAFTAAAGWKDRGFSIATKWYPQNPGAHEPERVKEALNTSLKELGTDCVDIFYLHAADRSVPFEKTLRAVNELHKEGKFVQLGLSNLTAFEVAEVVMTCKANGWVRPTIYQAMYNALSKSETG